MLEESWTPGGSTITLWRNHLLTRGIEHLISGLTLEEVPSLIHAHDWHAVVPGVKAKMSLEERRIIVPLVYTVHLLNKVGAMALRIRGLVRARKLRTLHLDGFKARVEKYKRVMGFL
nr:glycogen/starch synthase [Metallosphaera hakonensis]